MHQMWPTLSKWKLGKIQHTYASHRSIEPKSIVRITSRGILSRVRKLFFPWGVFEYPGYQPILAKIIGVGKDHTRKVTSGSAMLSDKGRARLINWLEGQLFELQSIIQALKDEQTALDFKRTHDPKYNRTARLIKARAALAAKQGQPTRKSKP